MIQYKLTNKGLEILRVVFGGYYLKTFYNEYEKLNDFKFKDEIKGGLKE